MTGIKILGAVLVKAAAIALIVGASIVPPAQAQTAPDLRQTVEQYYQEYLSKVPWGQVSAATTFKSLSLGQRVTLGDGTPFNLCKAIKDINGENTCDLATDYSRFVCPFTPPAITCTAFYMSGQQRDPALTAVATAFGNSIRPSFTVALDNWFPATGDRRLSGRIMEITLKAENPSSDFVPSAVDHFTSSTGERPQITVDDKDKDIISRECKQRIDQLYKGRVKTQSEVAEALNKCETDSLEKFFISTTRSVYYAWTVSDPGLRANKAVSMGVHRDLMGTRVILTMSYNSAEAERELKSRIDALVKGQRDERVKEDF